MKSSPITRRTIARSILGAAMVAMPWSVFAQPNYGLQFDGTNDRVDLGNDVASGIRSIELWFRPSVDITPNTSLGGVALLIRNDAFQTHEFGLYFRGTEWPTGRGYLYFFMRHNGMLHEIVSDEYLWSADAWHHVCGTIDANQGMKLYVDGVLQSSADPAGTVPIPSSAEITTIGTWGDALVRYFPGTIDEVRLWDRALSAAEVLDNMCWALEPPVNGLEGYWPLDEGGGATAFDATTGAHDGAVNGATYVLVNNCVAYVGIAEALTAGGAAIAPNPCSEECVLTMERPVKDATLTIVDALGAVVFRQQGLSGGRFGLSRTGLADGTYTLMLTESSGGLIQRVPLVIAASAR